MRDLRSKVVLAVTSALVGTLSSLPAYAQAGGGAEGETNAAEIVVTARRVEERLQDVPISITVYNQQQLANRNIVNPSDLATYTPSLSVNSRFGSEKSSFAIRGFNQELGTAPSVGVYFADVVAPRASGPTTSGNGTMPGALFDLQNVQVLKGPQGTLFGRNTTGGAVLLVPQKPSDRREGYVEVSVGNYDMRRLQAVFNTPIADTARLRLGVDRMTREGYLRNRSGIGPSDFGNVDYLALRASLVVDLTENLENYTIVSYTRSDTHGSLPRLITCGRDAAALPGATQKILAPLGCAQLDRQNARGDGFYDVENSVPDPFVDLRQWQVINTTTWAVNDKLTIKNIVSYAEFREATRININGDNLFLRGAPLHFATVWPGPTGLQAHQSTFTEELQLQGSAFDERLNYQFGGYVERSEPLSSGTQFTDIFMNCTDVYRFQCQSPLGPLGRVSLNDLRYRFHNLGAYGQATFKITDQLSATGGLRYTYDWTEGTARSAFALFPAANTPVFNCTKQFVSPGVNLQIPSLDSRELCRETLDQESKRPTWMINLDWKPNEDTLVYVKYSRGYRQGAVNLIPTGAEFQTVGPEKVDVYEVGLKTQFDAPVPARLNVTGFWNDFTDQQIQANLIAKPGAGLGGNVPINAGESRIRGVEAEVSVNPLPGLQIDASYAYLDAKLLSISLPTLSPTGIYSSVIPTASPGQPLIYSPRNKLTVTATYRLPLPEEIGRVSVAATYTHTDKQYSSRADDAFVNVIGYNPGLLPATDLLNLNLNWSSVAGRPVDLSVFATNVTGEKYRTAITNGFGTAGYETVVLGEPRMYGVRLRYRFGD